MTQPTPAEIAELDQDYAGASEMVDGLVAFLRTALRASGGDELDLVGQVANALVNSDADSDRGLHGRRHCPCACRVARGRTMTQPTPIPEAMIEAAAAAYSEHDTYVLVGESDRGCHWNCACGAGGVEPTWDAAQNGHRHGPTAVLAAALATCEATTHTEWASEHVGDLGLVPSPFLQETGRDRALAEMRVTDWRENRPDVATRLLRAEVTVYRLPWVPVEAGGESA